MRMTTSIKVTRHGCVHVGNGCYVDAAKFRALAEKRGYEVREIRCDKGSLLHLDLFWESAVPYDADNAEVL